MANSFLSTKQHVQLHGYRKALSKTPLVKCKIDDDPFLFSKTEARKQ
jgi:hypothetical protein